MKKNAVKISGLLTLIFSILLLLSAAIVICSALEIDAITESLGEIIMYVYALFIYPIKKVLSSLVTMESKTLDLILSGVIAGFCLLMVIFSIKEISLSQKDDQSYANCKKTCLPIYIVKLLFVIYNIALIIISFANERIAKSYSTINESLFPYGAQIIVVVIALVYLLTFIFPMISFSKAGKLVANGGAPQAYDQNGQPIPNGQYYDPNQQMQNGQYYDPNQQTQNGQYYDPNQQTQGQYMGGVQQQAGSDGTVYQVPNYNVPEATPLDPNAIIQPIGNDDGNVINIIPGQDGVPVNITPKGIEDLARLERLRLCGSIDEANYQIMKEKICSTNIM